MFTRSMKMTSKLLCIAAIPASLWCTTSAFGKSPCGKAPCAEKVAAVCGGCHKSPCAHTHATCEKSPQANSDMPPNAAPGECWARVQIPAQYRTVTERIMTREASDRVEIIPAKLDWVEERVCAKEGYKQLVEVPAEYKWDERTVQVRPAHANWVCKPVADCKPQTKSDQQVCDVFCLVQSPAEFKTIRVQCQVKPACVREVNVPAEFQTVKRQVLICKASVKKLCTPAEYTSIEKIQCIADGGMRWERSICTEQKKAETMNDVKRALIADGYKTGPLNGEFADADWAALRNYQQKNGLGVGALSYETMKKMNIRIN